MPDYFYNLSFNQFFRNLFENICFFQFVKINFAQLFLYCFFVNFLPKLNFENCIRALIKNLREIGHATFDLPVEVVGTPHVPGQEILCDEPGASLVVVDCYLVPIYFLNFKVRDTREIVIHCQTFRIPERLAPLGSFSSGGGSFRFTPDSGSEDVGRALHKHLGDLVGRLGQGCARKVRDLALWVILLHGSDHQVTLIIKLDADVLDVLIPELSHQRLKLESFRRTSRVAVIPCAVLLPMTRSIKDVENLLGRTCSPILVKTLSLPSDNIFREIASPSSLDL
jgi:hypothetical protein